MFGRTIALRSVLLLSCLTVLPQTVWSQTPPLPAVTVTPATLQDVGLSATFNGRAVAVQKVDIRARVSGFLTEMGFTEGGRVAQGATLFRIDDAEFRAQLDQADASVAAAEAALQLAKVENARQAELLARKAAPQAAVDRTAAEEARAAAELKRLKAVRDTAALNLSYTEITAPFAGQIGLSSVNVGALVGPDSGALATLVLNDPMTVEFPVPERIYLQTRSSEQAAGAGPVSVTLILSDGSTFPVQGKIDFTDVAVSQSTDTIMIRAVFDNADGTLRDGSLVSVRLGVATATPELTVPQQAVQRDVTGDFVLTVDQANTVVRKPVQVSRLAGGVAVISSGLAEGDLVITDGTNKARPGTVVDAAQAGGN